MERVRLPEILVLKENAGLGNALGLHFRYTLYILLDEGMSKFSKVSLFVLGFLFSCLFFVTLTLHNDHVQILMKVFKLIDTGVWTHFGNAGTGVGFVPGSFLTAVAAFPMMVWFSPYSAMAVILLFHIIAWALYSKILKENFGSVIVLDFLLLFWLSPWRVEQSELYNPAYIFLFAAMHFYTSYYMSKKSFWLTFFHVLAVGFCAQVHYSVLILVFLSLLLYVLRFVKVSWPGFIAGTVVVLLSLAPYLQQYLTQDQLAVTLNKDSHSFLGRNLILVYPVLKGISYWIRYGAINYGRHIFSEINFMWIHEGVVRTIVHHTFHALKWVFAIVTLLWSAKIQGTLFWNIWKKDHPFKLKVDRTGVAGRERISMYAFYLFFAMLAAVALSPVELNHWHLILCFPTITAIMTMAFNDLRSKLPPKRFKAIFITVLIVFCTFDLFGGLGSRVHSTNATFHDQVMKLYQEYKNGN